MPEWIGYTSHTPPMAFRDRPNLGCAGLQRPLEHRIRIGNREDDPHRRPAQPFRAEIQMLRRLVPTQNSAPSTESRATTFPSRSSMR